MLGLLTVLLLGLATAEDIWNDGHPSCVEVTGFTRSHWNREYNRIKSGSQVGDRDALRKYDVVYAREFSERVRNEITCYKAGRATSCDPPRYVYNSVTKQRLWYRDGKDTWRCATRPEVCISDGFWSSECTKVWSNHRWSHCWKKCKGESKLTGCDDKWGGRIVRWFNDEKFSECGAFRAVEEPKDKCTGQKVMAKGRKLNDLFMSNLNQLEFHFEAKQCWNDQPLYQHVLTENGTTTTHTLQWTGFQWVFATDDRIRLDPESGYYFGRRHRLAFCGHHELSQCSSNQWHVRQYDEQQDDDIDDSDYAPGQPTANTTSQTFEVHPDIQIIVFGQPLTLEPKDNTLLIVMLCLVGAAALVGGVFALYRCNNAKRQQCEVANAGSTAYNRMA